MRPRCVLVMIALATTVVGCARHASAPKPVKKPVASPKATILLPDWAPKQPSPEFLRAAQVLKPIPQEAPEMEGGRSSLSVRAAWTRYLQTLPAAYEFFGTMSDEQIARFLSAKEIRVPVKSMAPAQRAALDKWFRDWQAAFKGSDIGAPDWLVVLYKMGATRDLSNVSAGFSVLGRTVRMWFWVTQPDGQVKSLGNGIAAI